MIQSLAVAVGAAAGLATILRARRLGRAEPGFWCWVLIVMQAIYVIFALVAREPAGALGEALLLAVFTAVAVAGARFSAWLLAFGILAHTAWDLRHLLAEGTFASWLYPEACVGYDGLVALYLLTRAGAWDRRRRAATREEATP